jgi:hypothetical protein
MSKIDRLMTNTVDNNNSTEFDELNIKILKLIQDQKRIDDKRVDDNAFNYFKNKFPQYEIDIKFKLDGVQLGCKVIIYKEENEKSIENKKLTYYVKTHSDGLTY